MTATMIDKPAARCSRRSWPVEIRREFEAEAANPNALQLARRARGVQELQKLVLSRGQTSPII